MKTKISIIIPTKNRSSDLEKTLLNVKKINSSEIIVVENNSSKDELQNYKKICKDQKVLLMNLTGNIGAGDARNAGIETASGKYVFFLDDDDQVTDNFIKFLNENLGSLSENVYRFSLLIDKGGVKKPGAGKTLRKTFAFDLMQPSSYLCKLSFINDKKIRFAEKVVHQDTHFSEMIWSSNEPQHIIKVASIIYNTCNESITRSNKTLSKEIASIDEFNNPKYINGNMYKFKLIAHCFAFYKTYKIDCTTSEWKSAFYKRFKDLKNSKSLFFKLPAYYKFVYISWVFKTLILRNNK